MDRPWSIGRAGRHANYVDRIGAPRPRAVHRGIGMIDQNLWGGRWCLEARYADTDTDVAEAIFSEQDGERFEKLSRNGARVPLRAAVKQHAEVVAPEPRGDVPGSEAALENLAGTLQQDVPRAMAKPIVQRLEAIEVNVRDGERIPGVARAFDCATELVEEQSPVWQPGERVGPREMLFRCEQFFEPIVEHIQSALIEAHL